MLITIDGPAGSGKSTVASELAKKLNFYHFNSGSLYRGITAHAIRSGIDKNEDLNKCAYFDMLELTIKFIDGIQHVFVNAQDMTPQLRDNAVSTLTPKLSAVPKVRQLVDSCQKTFAKKHNLVVDGRDIGSYVFPNAEIKFYLDCDIKTRAKRRQNELKQLKQNIALKTLMEEIKARDEFDKNKTIAPLVVPKDAIIIDSSNLTIEEVVNKMIGYYKNIKS